MEICNNLLVIGGPESGKTYYIESLLSRNMVPEAHDLIWVTNEKTMSSIKRVAHDRSFGKNFRNISYFRLSSPQDIDVLYDMIRECYEESYNRYKCMIVFDDIPLYLDDMERKISNFICTSQKYGTLTIITARSSQWAFMSILKHVMQGVIIFQMPMHLIGDVLEGMNIDMSLIYRLYDDIILKAGPHQHLFIDCSNAKANVVQKGCSCCPQQKIIAGTTLERDSKTSVPKSVVYYPKVQSIVRLSSDKNKNKNTQ